MVFNVVAHNRDDHVKNFSYLMRQDGAWELAPAYDLTFSGGINGWHTMDVVGEALDPTRSHMLEVAERVGLNQEQAARSIEEVRGAVAQWPLFARELELPRAVADDVWGVLDRGW